MESSPELPECPVCLQNYDGASAVPRVLACGHSVCEACLARLPERFPGTIRCPACTQLVKYPPAGPTALPKNIDLLSFSLSINPNPNSTDSERPRRKVAGGGDGVFDFLPRVWSDEFYGAWKGWVLPDGAVLVEREDGEGERDGLCTVLRGRTGSGSGSGSGFGSGRFGFREDQRVGLVRVGSLPGSGGSGFQFSYIVKVMKCLSEMSEEERKELGFLLKVSVGKCRRIGKVYGLWGNLEDEFLYMVCESENRSFSERMNALSGDGDGFGRDGMSAFAMVAMEVCEAVAGLHSDGFVSGCFGVSCFSFDDFGHVEVDLSEVLVTGRKVWRIWGSDGEVLGVRFGNLLRDDAFVSPEVLFEVVECDSKRCQVGCGSDVWSLACVLLRLLFGREFSEEIVKSGENLFHDHGSWIERVSTLLERILGSEYASLSEILCKCLDFDPAGRPLVIDVVKCIRELLVKPQFDVVASLDGEAEEESVSCCLILGELCQMAKQRSKTRKEHGLQGSEVSGGAGDQVEVEKADNGVVAGLAEGKVKSKVMQGHRGPITGLAVGGKFLFSSSFDKTIHVWSLQDFSHVHTFIGHQHAIKALIYIDELEQALCVSGDDNGEIFVWGTRTPLQQDPLKIFFEEKDWRFSGIHALASRNGYFYTGSGDTTVKAWSLQDGTMSCTMSGHRSVVSTLAVCDDVLYSGSWDGTIRLWSLSDHSPLTVLGEDTSGPVASVLSLVVDRHVLIATHENGCVKVWRNDVFKKSIKMHNGAIFAIGMEGQWLFTGGWDKTVNVQELSGDELEVDSRPIGTIPSDSVITTLLGWQGKLFVGYANGNVMVFYHG